MNGQEILDRMLPEPSECDICAKNYVDCDCFDDFDDVDPGYDGILREG